MDHIATPPIVTAELTRRRLLVVSKCFYAREQATDLLNQPLNPVRRLISSSVEAAPTKLTRQLSTTNPTS